MVPEYQQPEIYRLLPRAVEDSLRHLLSRGLGFALLGLVAVSWLSLVTWSVTDPGDLELVARVLAGEVNRR